MPSVQNAEVVRERRPVQGDVEEILASAWRARAQKLGVAAALPGMLLAAGAAHAQTINSVIANQGGLILEANATAEFQSVGFRNINVGDLNGDGIDDLAVGAPGRSGYSGQPLAGAFHIVFGDKLPLDGSTAELEGRPNDQGFIVTGPADIAQFGYGAAIAGLDFNGDGIQDLVVGMPNQSPLGGASEGVVRIFPGPINPATGVIDLATSNPAECFEFHGYDGFRFGQTVASIGDVNGDGIDDLAIGFDVPFFGYLPSVMVVFGTAAPFPEVSNVSDLGPNAPIFVLPDADSRILTVAKAGDFNGDGIDDFQISGEYRETGPTYVTPSHWVVFGDASMAPGFRDLLDLASDEWLFTYGYGESVNSLIAGFSAAGGFDFNGDGFDDVAFSIPLSTIFQPYAGLTAIVFGDAVTSGPVPLGDLIFSQNKGHLIIGSEAGGYSGVGLTGVKDLNGDGFDELLLTVPGANGFTGRARLINGRTTFAGGYSLETGILDSDTFTGPLPPTFFGFGVLAMEFSDRPNQELIIGAPYGGVPSTRGQVFIIGGDDRPNLELEKTANSGLIKVGDNVQFTFTVSNLNPDSTATLVLLEDSLPAGLALQTVNAPGGTTVTQVGNGFTVQLGEVAAAPKVVTATATGVAPGLHVNSASVSAKQIDADGNNNTDSAPVGVIPVADLAVTKTGDTNGTIGVALNYTVVVTNNGPSAAQNVSLVDLLPPGVTVNSATSGDGSVTQAAGQVTLSVASLAPSASATLNIQVTPTTAGSKVNLATATADAFDSDSSNNTDFAATNVVDPLAPPPGAVSDLAVVKSAPTDVLVGQAFDYTIALTNSGPNAAANVVLTDLLPEAAGFVVTNANSNAGTVTIAAGTVTVDIANLPSGGAAAITISGFATKDGSLNNVVSVSSDSPDSNAANNISSALTSVATGPGADLSGRFDPTKPPAVKLTKKGESIQARVVVFNTGDAEAGKSTARFYLSADGEFDPATNTLIATRNLGKIKPLKQRNLAAKGTLTTGTASGQYILAVLDADNIVPEGNEFNNVVKFGPLP